MSEDTAKETIILPEIRIRESQEFSHLNLREEALPYAQHEAETLQFEFAGDSQKNLPKGLTISEEGIVRGVISAGTARKKPYNLVFIGKGYNKELIFKLKVFVHPSAIEQTDKGRPVDFTLDKAEAWMAIAHDLGLPSLQEIVERPITKSDVYYLLGRFALLEVWNGMDLSLPGEGKMLFLQGASDKFHIFDFGVCLVSTPVDLFSHERGVSDNVKTAAAMVNEAHRRGWYSLEFAGYDRMVNAAWRTVKALNAISQQLIEVRNYEPD